MEKEFVKYEQALALKELGFDEPCLGYYTHNQKLCIDISTNDSVDFQMCTHIEIYKTYSLSPTFSQAFKWFREKHRLCNFINFSGDGFCSGWEDLGNNEHGFENFKTYEEAESACLDKLIEIIRLTKP